MTSPFPGMDPYLESKDHWPSFHHHLAEEIMTMLNAGLDEKYYAEVEIRTVFEEIAVATRHDIYPDVAVLDTEPNLAVPSPTATTLTAPLQRIAIPAGQPKLRTVRIYLTENRDLITVIEILSPVNKQGPGLERYRQKRDRILHTNVHLVEIDLLRRGQRAGWELDDPPLDTDYVCLVNRASYGEARISEIWPVALSEPLPTLPIPLLAPDPDSLLDLGAALNSIYTRAAYARRLDYRQPIPPPDLRPAMRTWLQETKIAADNQETG